ncbi:MAG: NAD(P)H-dependent oxidoreductase [Candidatus Heimdallarchaeota archaeon]|nr:NAD(P)H-dependent oxidoreductase [Candidatus Heimdallarchaeota archaeon]
MTKKILVILGHPMKESLNSALADAYKKGAESVGAEVECLCIRDLHFNPNLASGYHIMTELEPDLLIAQKKIQWADHLVWIYPTWWGLFPAIMKGFIDRTFLPGFSHKYHKGKILPERLLKKKTARIITTLDGFYWLFNLLLRPGIIALKMTMRFVGIRPRGVTAIDRVRKKSETKLEKVLLKVKKLGQKLK